MAGVSPFLTAGEVFKSPSRTARLIEAYWCYCEVTYSDKLWKLLLRPAIHGGVLAPTQAQRLNYRHWTEVTTVLYDVFEPNRIRAALQRSERNLGHLIFSQSSWAAFLGELTSPATDPLTRMFGERGLTNSPTFLRDSQFYGSLFVNEGSRVERQTYCYRFDKQYWSVTPAFPLNMFVNQKYASDWNIGYEEAVNKIKDTTTLELRWQRTTLRSLLASGKHSTVSLQEMIADRQAQLPRWPLSQFYAVTGVDRINLLFKTIVQKNTRDVAIGPLEYCGTGHIVLDSHGNKILTVCWADVGSLPLALLKREVFGLNRRTSGIAKVGKAKKAMTNHSKEKAAEKVQKLLGSGNFSFSTLEADTNEQVSEQPVKRRRLSQDQRLALQNEPMTSDGGGKENFDRRDRQKRKGPLQ
ncbi:hypothetical protein LENED_010147 [Lentinula edodes]|uniref:Uncharacterized protein n=1 Tax=Lentinula edodes TaxID=5353 RepID=A0A1Q3ELP3_LENED|nr:hypothetical protein LENED_010147 [Lentinula edodes]